ncbi:MAG: hemerythrin family protein [Magnetococcales bacterium]|nr:hemerythrin family protein [Magnetococcales bacterium]
MVGGRNDDQGHYTSWHFRHEERLMQSRDYPKMDAHKKEHKRFILQIQDIQRKFEQGDKSAPSKLNVLVKIWLSNHILHIDNQLAAFLLYDGQSV